jgi:hypothetical protein
VACVMCAGLPGSHLSRPASPVSSVALRLELTPPGPRNDPMALPKRPGHSLEAPCSASVSIDGAARSPTHSSLCTMHQVPSRASLVCGDTSRDGGAGGRVSAALLPASSPAWKGVRGSSDSLPCSAGCAPPWVPGVDGAAQKSVRRLCKRERERVCVCHIAGMVNEAGAKHWSQLTGRVCVECGSAQKGLCYSLW